MKANRVDPDELAGMLFVEMGEGIPIQELDRDELLAVVKYLGSQAERVREEDTSRILENAKRYGGF